jgi:hypothetical protein
MKTYVKIGLRAIIPLFILWHTTVFYPQAVRAADGDLDSVEPQFTNASLNGSYAGYVIGARGGDVGISGILRVTFDGAGNSTGGTSVWNVGGEVVTSTFEGAYMMTPDGFVHSVAPSTGSPTGSNPLSNLDFSAVITKSRKIDNHTRLALELVVLTNSFGPAEHVITILFTRQTEE